MKRRDFVSATAAVIVAPTVMSAVPTAPILCIDTNCQSGSLSNGASFVVTGSGFGTKSASAPTIYDNCQGTSLAATGWINARAFYTVASILGEPWGETYRLPTDVTPNGDTWGATAGCIVNPATPLRSKYLCSALMSKNMGGYAAASLMFGYTWPTLVPPFYIVASWYETYSPNWLFGVPYQGAANDNNFKWVNYTTSLTGPYNNNVYWYMEYGNSRFTGPTSTPWIDINDDGAGIVGRQPPPNQGGEYVSSPLMPNQYYNGINGWVKKELIMYMTSGTNGWIRLYTSVPNYANPGHPQARFQNYYWYNAANIGTGRTDPYLGIGRGFYLGGFRRDFPQARNRQYWSDIYLDMQPGGVGRIALTDTNSLSTATVIEYQPYTSWSNTSVTLTCSKGNLQSGRVYAWLLDEVNGNKSLGSYTMS
jgi:hypothetical protein